MLRYLRIRNLAVIEQVQVEFEPGLNVLTGETGAGKSVLVEAVGLLLGGRASSDLVRTGEDVAQVEAQFQDGDVEVVLRREVTAQGRSRAFVNGSLVTAGALREFSDRLVELHGQHEHQILMDPESHLSLLDSYAGLENDRVRVGEAFARLQALRTELQALQLDERQKAARIDLLTFQRDEISRAQVQPGEDEELAAIRQVLVNAEKLQRLSADAYAALYESDGAVLGALTAIWRRVGELAALDPRVTPYLDNRDAIKSQLEDLAFFLRGYADDIDASPGRLQEVEDRLVLLDRLKRKYGPTLADVVAHHDRAVQDLADLANMNARGEVIAAEVSAAAAAYLDRARALSAARRIGGRAIRGGARSKPGGAGHGTDAVRRAFRRPGSHGGRSGRRQVSTGPSSSSRRTPARSCAHSRASHPGASCHASCWRCAACRSAPVRHAPWSSTRWTPGLAAGRQTMSDGSCRGWEPTRRCSALHTSRRLPPAALPTIA